MARAPKLLRILVHDDIDGEAFNALRDKGHIVDLMSYPMYEKITEYDLVVGPNAWRMTPELTNMIDVAIKAARKAKYE